MAANPKTTEFSTPEITLHLLGASGTTAPADANLVDVTSIGDLPSEMNMAEWHTYGSVDAKQFPTTRGARMIDVDATMRPADTQLLALETAHNARTVRYFALNRGEYEVVVGGAGDRIVFQAYVSKFTISQATDDVSKIMFTLSVTGEVTRIVNDN